MVLYYSVDINITRTNGHFSTSVFHKPSSTGLFTDFNSFIPMTCNKGLLLSLNLRQFNICFSYQYFHCEHENLNQYFLVTVIQSPLLITALLGLFSTKYFRLSHLFIPALKGSFLLHSFHWSTWFKNTHTALQISFICLPTYSGCQKYESSPIFAKKLEIRLYPEFLSTQTCTFVP